MRQHWKPDLQHELSSFLIVYLLVLLSVLMLVHASQPERVGSGTSSRSPVHQERQQAK